jgi:hypothetical protein
MQMGRRLIYDLGLVDVNGISHLNFKDANDLILANGDRYYSSSLHDIQQALSDLYGGQEVSLQQLSATFRRGDLIERLFRIEMPENKD